MRIDKVEIDGFGKLNNVSFEFTDGVNLIFGENESGKSTLCEFILAAFYGLPNESKKTADDMPPRKKYRPWNAESYGGRVYFTHEGRELVIERSFKGTKRGDKAVLRDAKSWEELDNSDDFGTKIFGLSREAFLKTLYVKSFGADSLKTDDGEIMSRLSNLETSGTEDVSYSKIMNGMEKEIFSLKTKTGRGGKISALEDRITTLNSELSMSAMTYSSLDADAQMAENLKNAAKEKEKEAELTEKKYNLALAYEKYTGQQKIAESKQMMEKRIAESEEKLKQTEEQIANLDSGKAVSVTADEISRARALETKKLMAEEKCDNLKSTPEAKSNVFWGAIPLLLFGVCLLVYSIVKANNFLIVAGGVIMVLSVAFLIVFRVKSVRKKNEREKEISNAETELENINKELSEIFAPYGVNISDELSAVFMSTKNTEEKKTELQKRYNELKAEIETLSKSIPQEEITEFSDEVISYKGESSSVLFEKINILKNESKQMAERAHEISVRLVRETAEIRSEAEIKEEIKSLTEEIAEAQKRYNALTKAAEWLASAHDEIKNNFAPRLNKKASEFLSVLTEGKYSDIRANDSFGINLKSTGGEIVEAGYMSRGTYDVLYIALRFAAMSVLTDGKIPPVILDDAFSQLDDSRLLAATEMINKNPEFSQVLLFTCHENYKELLNGKNINTASM